MNNSIEYFRSKSLTRIVKLAPTKANPSGLWPMVLASPSKYQPKLKLWVTKIRHKNGQVEELCAKTHTGLSGLIQRRFETATAKTEVAA